MLDSDKMADSVTLTKRQRAAIAAILSTPTLQQAADQVGVTRRTLYRWLNQAEFRAALAEAQSDALGVVVARLAGLLGKALDVIGLDLGLGVDGKVRLRAALGILGHYAALAEFLDLASRVAALEQSQGVKDGGKVG